jgi:MSHA biogenesis protein MshQ
MEIVDTLPAGISFLAGTGTGWVCGGNAQLVTCDWTGAIDSGAVAPDLVLMVAVSSSVVGTITNTATVTGTVIDNVLGNNTVSFTSGVFVPTYVFTNQLCSNGFAIGQPGQTCSILTWSPQVAGQSKSGIFITAVNPLGVPTALNSVSSTSIAFQFGLTCHDPVANAGIQASFSAASPSTLPVCNGYSAEPVVWSSATSLNFAANVPSVSASYAFNYADVGLVELFMRNSVATTQKGTSGQFVVKPYNLVLSEIKPTANAAGRCAVATSPAPTLTCASLAADAATFVKAGETFSVTVTALASSGSATPNFGKEKAPESVKLSPGNMVTGMLSPPPAVNGSFANFNAGVANGSAFNWSEVGIITLTPQIADGNYLGVGDVVGTVSGNVGRFYPDHFDTTLTPGCSAGSFTYSGQPFTLVLNARNASSDLTLNYAGSAGGGPGFSRNVALSEANSVAGYLSVGSVSSSAFAAGVASTTTAFSFNAVSTPPSLIKLRAVDTDSVSSASSSEGVSYVRIGRARLDNAYGSELLSLPMQFALEYWGPKGWTKNTSDSCTGISSSNFSFDFSTPAGTTNKPNNMSACKTALTVTGTAPDYLLSLALGMGAVSSNGQCLAVGGAGSADVPAQLPWLQFNWKGAGLTNPSARALFGIYKKDSASGVGTIYRRENY